jgi:signal transduction histidine kinase
VPINGALNSFDSGAAREIGDLLFTIALAALPISVGLAVLRYRLFEIDWIISRTLVYATLSSALAGVYLAMVLGSEAALHGRLDAAAPLVGAGIVAVAFAPLRELFQSVIDRRLFGQRRSPYEAVSQLSRRLEALVPLEDVMPTLTEMVATALRLPYAAIELASDGDFALESGYGELSGASETFPLHYRGEVIGRMILGVRSGTDSFSAADRRVLEGLLAHGGVAAHSVALTRDLQRSRERIVLAREEERRRIRRDLHDGLGPELTAAAFRIDLARMLLPNQQERADKELGDLRQQMGSVIEDVRRLVYDLRPPVLDEMGLAGSLQEHAARLSSRPEEQPTTMFSVTCGELPALPAAIEVAAFRIAMEAMTNSARHSGASRCEVILTVAERLELRVVDDGKWRPNGHNGVGIASMRERAHEVGGSFSVGPGAEGGTQVYAALPLRGSG